MEIYNYKMIQKPAAVMAEKTFRRETLSFDKISNQSKIFLDFQSDSPPIKVFYPEKNTDLKEFAGQVLANYKIDRAELCDGLAEMNESLDAGSRTYQNIELLREKDCTAIVTGQQAGLFSGALYTIYKAFSAIKFADDLRKKNIKAVPVFWIAEEDHDFDEVKKTFNLDKGEKLFKSENTPENYTKNSPVGLVVLDETINQEIEKLFENLPHTEFTDETKKLLKETYQAGETYSRAFGKFIARLFADYGLIIVSPLNEKLKKLAAPIFAEAIDKSAAIAAALMERNIELKVENYQPQVLVTEDFFPFFFQSDDGERQSLRRNLETGKIKIQKSKTEFAASELLEIARRAPHNLSPNALLRPVVQDYLLPTLAYFGGAAEIAYFAQNSAIYKVLNRPVTPIRHRSGFSIIERQHGRTLEKYHLNFKDVFAGKEKISTQIVEEFLSPDAARAFGEVEKNINAQLDYLAAHLSADEPTLAANLANRRKKILWHVGAMRKKYQRTEMQKNEVVNRRLEDLFTALLPHGALQERTLNVITFLNLYGENWIDWIYEAVEPNEINHRILYF